MRRAYGVLFGLGLLVGGGAWAQGDGSKEKKEDGLVIVSGAGKLKLSGYIQAQYRDLETSANGDVTDGFGVRRARIKLTYQPAEWTALVLQLDGISSFPLKDAEVHLIEPFTGQGWELVVGQMKWPFGYSVQQSSSVRELPERSRVIRAFFPGERDRGAKIIGNLGPIELDVGVYDGNGIDYTMPDGTDLTTRDNDTRKDVLARVSTDLGPISGGISGQLGETFDPGDADAGIAASGFHPRNRLGADVQVRIPLLGVGFTKLQAEAVRGTTWSRSGREQFGAPAFGWYALVTQEVGNARFTARYDWFDGQLGLGDVAGSNGFASSRNSVGTLAVAASYTHSKVLRLTAAYEWVTTSAGPVDAEDPKDNVFTLQLQAKY